MRFSSRLLGLALAGAWAFTSAKALAAEPPHMDLEMTSREYEAMMARQGGVARFRAKGGDELGRILEWGQRNIAWLEVINAARPPEAQLPLSTPESTRAIPIDQPRSSNPTIIQADLLSVQQRMPEAMRAVIFSDVKPYPANTVGVDDETFLELARDMDRVYQAASRWLLQEPQLAAYKARSYLDIRGYYYLQREPDLRVKLAGWSELADADKSRLGEHLVGLCHNSRRSKADCRAAFRDAQRTGAGVVDFHARYLPYAKAVWDDFFVVRNPRSEARWTSTRPNDFVMPFAEPGRQDVRDWLAANIEDEWRWGDWALSLAFGTNRGYARVEFEAGATPHVNGLGGGIITMDANRPLDEYSVRWTIRHEFGHVLGFPDCYIEFYDGDAQAMVNYQIDVDNLMCSRRGHLQQGHVEELRKNYFRRGAIED